ncbi:MAG TPA: UDP-N-acetylmuramoyl-L-alanine--D-glutamate ligase [Bacteroidia bacterium]|nr:UDP-N-acetylmuramoyl-L-alanine--D-glutamate ligase [Bacteroidia bacterium]HNS12275.1 UDP-N-acetylmuramoyl-L-alanine--D-glutamate ligase [Bacteroidia bacterium]
MSMHTGNSSSSLLVVLGAAESGVGAAVLAKEQGQSVFVSDAGVIKPEYKAVLSKHRIKTEEGKHSEELILSASEVIKSPGIPDKTPLLKKIKEKNISVISEIEYAGRFTKACMVGITGTNGKTTTTLLTHHILEKEGLKVGLAGNVGKSLAMQVAHAKHEYYVLELSSFQLDGLFDFKCDVAVLTNITPDHLDRYDYDVEKYAQSKFRICQNQTSNDAFIYCADDELTLKYFPNEKIKAHQYPFSIHQILKEGAWLENNQLQITTNKHNFSMLIHELALQGKHNLYNSMAAGISARVLEIRKETVRESLSDFKNVEHRLEFVGSVHGIEFVNDSKATNVNSTWYALESFNKPVVLILGGVDKGNDYSMLTELVKEKVKGIVCLGTDNKKILKAFKDIVPNIVEVVTAEAAVNAAYQMSKKGDVVLLSPSCASFDIFENYEDRGRQFKQAVRAL